MCVLPWLQKPVLADGKDRQTNYSVYLIVCGPLHRSIIYFSCECMKNINPHINSLEMIRQKHIFFRLILVSEIKNRHLKENCSPDPRWWGHLENILCEGPNPLDVLFKSLRLQATLVLLLPEANLRLWFLPRFHQKWKGPTTGSRNPRSLKNWKTFYRLIHKILGFLFFFFKLRKAGRVPGLSCLLQVPQQICSGIQVRCGLGQSGTRSFTFSHSVVELLECCGSLTLCLIHLLPSL